MSSAVEKAVYSWGWDEYGQLGHGGWDLFGGTKNRSPRPIKELQGKVNARPVSPPTTSGV
eukprot:1452525-Rhodomonas_salina.2